MKSNRRKMYGIKSLKELITVLENGGSIDYEDFRRYKKRIKVYFMYKKEYAVQELIGNALVVFRLANGLEESDLQGMEDGHILVAYLSDL